MATILLVAAESPQRARWGRSLLARGFTVAEAPVLISALAQLTADEIAAIVVEAEDPDSLVVLAALSNVCALPPVVVVGAGAGPTVPMRVPAFRRVRGTVPPALVADHVAGVLADCLDSAPQLPLRLAPVLDAKWTTRLVARLNHDDWAGSTEPYGFDLT